MKKVLGLLLVLTLFVMAGCEEGEEILQNVEDLTVELSDLADDLAAAQTALTEAQGANDTLTTDLETLQNTVAGLQTELDALNAENDALQAEVDETSDKVKNALNRDSWDIRKVRYNADWTNYDAEYCFGVFDEDWTTITANDYTYGEGLKFVITIEELAWGTEIFAKDSCGNYSVFIYPNSNYAFYSAPFGLLEEGKTYEVVLYKEMYFTEYQLGLLPSAEMVMGDFGLTYPVDLSGIMVTEVE